MKKQNITLVIRYIVAIAITALAIYMFMDVSKKEDAAKAAADTATEIVVETETD